MDQSASATTLGHSEGLLPGEADGVLCGTDAAKATVTRQLESLHPLHDRAVLPEERRHVMHCICQSGSTALAVRLQTGLDPSKPTIGDGLLRVVEGAVRRVPRRCIVSGSMHAAQWVSVPCVGTPSRAQCCRLSHGLGDDALKWVGRNTVGECASSLVDGQDDLKHGGPERQRMSAIQDGLVHYEGG